MQRCGPQQHRSGLRCVPASRRECLSGITSFRWLHLALSATLIASFSAAPLSAALHAQEPPPEDPVALVRAASWNELHSSNQGHPYRFRLRKQDENGVTTKDIIETRDGDIARLVAVDDKPLTPERAKAERDRLDNLLAH